MKDHSTVSPLSMDLMHSNHPMHKLAPKLGPHATPSAKDPSFSILRKKLKKRIHQYYHSLEQLQLTSLWKRSWEQYYSGLSNLGRSRSLQSVGELMELTKVSVNDYGSILRNLHTLITRDPPLIDAKPINASTEAITETIPAKILLEFYQDQKYLDKEIGQAKLYELLFGTGYIVIDWEKLPPSPPLWEDAYTPPYSPPYRSRAKNATQPSLFENPQGDLVCSAHAPFDVIHPIYGSPQNISWYIVRTFHDRRELSDRYKNRRLLREGMLTSQSTGLRLTTGDYDYYQNDPEIIDVFTYYQKPCANSPEGLKLSFTKNQLLSHGTLSSKHLPVVRIANETLMNTTLGSTVAFDLLEIQKSKDSLISTIISNQANFGLNSIVVPKSAQLESNRLGSHLNILEVNNLSDSPRVLDLLRSNPEIFKMVSYLEDAMERISGINSVVRGQAHASQSGQALSLITSMSLQFASGYLRTFRETYKQCGERILALLKQNLPAGREYRITGKAGKVFQGKLSQTSLYDEYHISVELVSPLKSTLQGRELMATSLLEKGFIKEPRDFLSILLHGRIEDIITPEAKLKESLKHESELLIAGNPVSILELQNHPAFIYHDLQILNDHEQIKDKGLVHRVYAVILKRLATWKRVSAEQSELLTIAGIPLYQEEHPNLPVETDESFSQDSAVFSNEDDLTSQNYSENVQENIKENDIYPEITSSDIEHLRKIAAASAALTEGFSPEEKAQAIKKIRQGQSASQGASTVSEVPLPTEQNLLNEA